MRWLNWSQLKNREPAEAVGANVCVEPPKAVESAPGSDDEIILAEELVAQADAEQVRLWKRWG